MQRRGRCLLHVSLSSPSPSGELGDLTATFGGVVSAQEVAEYLERYIEQYRREYEQMTTPPPGGGGYPDLSTSPYLLAQSLVVYIATDGVVIADYGWEPPGRWDIAGGPALLIDYPDTRTPAWVREALEREGALGQHIGIFRIVSQAPLHEDVWNGRLPGSRETTAIRVGGTAVEIGSFDVSLTELVARLTFGAFGPVLDPHIPGQRADFWEPHIVRDLGFATADRKRRRFFHYLEILHHAERAAWDARSIPKRVYVDARRDFAASIGQEAGGTIQVPRAAGTTGSPIPFTTAFEAIANRVLSVSRALAELRNVVAEDRREVEYQRHLEQHPELLDAYGARFHARPRFRYPEGRLSPVGKAYVEPDFIIEYAGQRYMLVELERPGAALGTSRGQPSAATTAPAFQLAEWRSFIQEFPAIVEEMFPSLPHSYKTMIVMSRSTEGIGGGRDAVRYRQMVADTYNVDELFFYDELVKRGEVLLAQLAALGPAD
jgi:hypothetical protein